MVVVTARVQTKDGQRERFLDLGLGTLKASRQEDGCVSYRLYEDTEDPRYFTFVEEWESRDAVDRHFATPHFTEFVKELPSLVHGAPDIRIHEVTSTERL